MALQTAMTVWEGDFLEGSGLIVLGSGHFDEPYSFSSRFGDGKGTSPEELLGAAYAGSFSMAMAQELSMIGFCQILIQTSAKVCISQVENEYKITSVLLNTEAQVPDITVEKFSECEEAAISKCLLSNTLRDIDVKLKVSLIDGLSSQRAIQSVYKSC